MAKNDGVVGINFLPGFLDAELDKKSVALLSEERRKIRVVGRLGRVSQGGTRPPDKIMAEFKPGSTPSARTRPPISVKTVVDHIDHVVKVTGTTDHVGLGSDFDGISDAPVGLENAGRLAAVTGSSSARGYKENDIRKILGGNFRRVFGAVERAAKK